MRQKAAAALVLAWLGLASADSAEIQGTVVVEHRLTKARVTPAASSYSRGVPVELQPDPSGNGLDFERSHVVIYLEGAPGSKPVTAILEQKGRQFLPDLLVVPAGSTVSFPNLDPIFHNVFSLSKPKEFDLGNYPKDHTRTVTFAKSGVVFVNCHLHSNMSAVIFITPNQWNTRSDTAGRFRISDVPPGNYTIVAWHKAAGFFRQPVTVSDSGNSAVSFFIPLAADGRTVSK